MTLSAPSHLSPKSKDLWVTLTATRITSPERQTLLLAALECRDRLDQIREELDKSRLIATTKRTNTRHLNPLVTAETKCREQFLNLWQRLGLQSDYGR